MVIIERKLVAIVGSLFLLPMLFIAFVAISGSGSPARTAEGSTDTSINGGEISISVNQSGINPSSITIPSGKNVLLKVNNNGASGCTTQLIGKNLFQGALNLGLEGEEVQQIIKAESPGNYIISCWMGSVTMKVEAI